MSRSSMRKAATMGAVLLMSMGGAAKAGLLSLLGGDGGDTQTVGPFEITTHRSAHWVGAWETRAHTVRYSIRYRGEKLRLPVRDGLHGAPPQSEDRFNLVAAFGAQPVALLVNAGTPYERSDYHLLRDAGGRLVVEAVAPAAAPQGDMEWGTVEWADQPGPPEEPVSTGENEWFGFKQLGGRGGRWLTAGKYAFIDAQTLAIHRVPFPPDHFTSRRIVMRSPDRTSFARLSLDGAYPLAGHVVVFDVLRDSAYALPIDATRMRASDTSVMSEPDWLDHHFEWRGSAAKGFRLAERAHFKRLPIQGRVDGSHQGDEYRLEGAGPGIAAHFIAFAQREAGARLVPHTDPAAARPDGGETIAEWQYLVVGDTTLAIAANPDGGRLAFWRLRGPDEGLVRRLAEPFDRAVREGRYD